MSVTLAPLMDGVEDAPALSPEEFAAVMTALGPFETAPELAVAVSGGSDSMALALLAGEWAGERGGECIALTVDHGLRPESREEALQTGRWLAAYGIRHAILSRQPAESEKRTQADARAARYRLLTEWCRAQGILHLLAAHHLDDQAETYLLRQAQGSGADGLACMPALREMEAMRLLRPLLTFPKARLQTTLHARGQAWIEDPTNATDTYTRNRLRRAIKSQHGDYSAALLRQVQAHALARARREVETAQALAAAATILPEGYCTIHLPFMQTLQSDMRLRILSAAACAVSGSAYPPRTHKLARLENELFGPSPPVTRSFHGCLFLRPQNKRCAGQLLVIREPGAAQGHIPLVPGQPALWDNRFRVRIEGAAATPMQIGALKANGLSALRTIVDSRHLRPPLPALLLHSLPALWGVEGLLAAPHMHYQHAGIAHMSISIRFTPRKALAGAPFFCLK